MSTPEERGTDRGKAHWISGICPAGQSLPATAGAGGVLERIPSPAGPGGAATAGGPVHGLRRALLSVRGGVERYGLRLPTAQSGARVERPGVARTMGAGGGAFGADKPHARVHQPRVPGAVRGGMQPGAQRRGRDDPRQRAPSPIGSGNTAGRVASSRRARTRRALPWWGRDRQAWWPRGIWRAAGRACAWWSATTVRAAC